MRSGKDADRGPGALLHPGFEGHRVLPTIGRDLDPLHREAVDDQFHRDGGRGIRRRASQRRHNGPKRDAARRRKCEAAVARADFERRSIGRRGGELHQMGPAIADIAPPRRDRVAPGIKVEGPVETGIDASDPDPLAGHAGEVGLAAGPHRQAAVENVVPQIPFRPPVGVHHREEVDGRNGTTVRARDDMRHIHDELVGADAIEGGDVERRQTSGAVAPLRPRDAADDARQPAGRMGRAANSALPLRPAERVEPEGRPVLHRIPAGGNLLGEPEEIQVAGGMRPEARHLDVVAEEVRGPADVVGLPREKPFLEIEARAPREAAADLQILPHAVAQHVGRHHPLGGALVMGAAGGVDVVIARPIAAPRRVNPAPDGIAQLGGPIPDDERLILRNALGPARAAHRVAARREPD